MSCKRSTCLELSIPVPLTQNLREGRKPRQSNYGYLHSLKMSMNVLHFAYPASSTVRRNSDSDNFKIPLTTSVGHDGSIVGSSPFTRSNLQAKARRHKQNCKRLCRQSKTRLTSLSDVTVLPVTHSFNWTPVETGKTFTSLLPRLTTGVQGKS